MTKNIIVVEGPAGTGKSTLISKLEDTGVVKQGMTVLKIDKPRQYPSDPIKAGLLSQIIDYNLMMGAVLDPQPFVFIDRWAVSRWVYERIQRPNEPVTPDKELEQLRGYNIITNAYKGIQSGFYESMARIGMKDLFAGNLAPKIHFVFLNPSMPLLTKRREESGKKYPYSAAIESFLFQQAYYDLQMWYPYGNVYNLPVTEDGSPSISQILDIMKDIQNKETK